MSNNSSSDYDRLLNQLVDILIFDYNNKYQFLKQQNFDKQKINTIMTNYQFVRNKEFISDVNKLKCFI
jgi:hypothetical protein